MGLFSFFNKKDPYEEEMSIFLKSRDAALLHSNLKFYMGFKMEDLEDTRVKQKVDNSYSRLVSFAISYVVSSSYGAGAPLMRSQAAIQINKELIAICNCDYELARQFESDFFALFKIEEAHRFGMGI